MLCLLYVKHVKLGLASVSDALFKGYSVSDIFVHKTCIEYITFLVTIHYTSDCIAHVPNVVLCMCGRSGLKNMCPNGDQI